MRRPALAATMLLLAVAGCNWLLGFEDEYRLYPAAADGSVDAPAARIDAGAPPCTADTKNDEANCGRCGNACAANLRCNDGRCGTILRVAAGGDFACVLRDDGRVQCWGDNQVGQLAESPGDTRAQPKSIDIGENRFESIATGLDFACGAVHWEDKARHQSNVVCWGSNQSQQLAHERGTQGDELDVCTFRLGGFVACNWVPQEIRVPEPLTAHVLAAGYDAACAIGDGGTFCWGGNTYGQRGIPEEDAGDIANRVSGKSHYDALALSLHAEARVCARDPDGGLAQCWGSPRGSLGDAVQGTRVPTPVTVRTDPSTALTGVKELVNLRSSSCALTSDGLFCWGLSDTAAFGPDAGTANVFAVRGPKDLPPLAKISGSEGHVCAIDQDGKVWCWGLNGSGQLGRGHADGERVCTSERCETTPEPIPNFDAVDISAGLDFTVALRADGTVWTWGSTRAQKLGRPYDPAVDLHECLDKKPCSPRPAPVVGME